MRVLVLCHGSVNRSPYVAALIRAARPKWEVQAAALQTVEVDLDKNEVKPFKPRPATPKARRAAEKHGLSLDGHRSQPVTIELVLWADVVLYMDGGNEKRLRTLVDTLPRTEDWEVWDRCELLAKYGSLRRVPDPNYTSDPVVLAEQFAAAEFCTIKFLEKHP